jgi:hypothetical protein
MSSVSLTQPRSGVTPVEGSYLFCPTQRAIFVAKFLPPPLTSTLPSSKLDFGHLLAKGVGYARHQSPLKEVISRCAPYRPR